MLLWRRYRYPSQPLPFFSLYFLPSILPGRCELLPVHLGNLGVHPEARSRPTLQCYSSLVHLHRKDTVWHLSEQRPSHGWVPHTALMLQEDAEPRVPQPDCCICACAAAALALRGCCSPLVPQGPSLHA